MSSLKGPLDSICTHIASNPGPWREWYGSERPETQPLPIETEGASLSVPHKLLMIRALRSDRFERAMRMFVENEVGDLIERTLPPFDEVLSGIKHSIPIFVVMPDHSSVNTPFKICPVESIRRMAEVRRICKAFTLVQRFLCVCVCVGGGGYSFKFRTGRLCCDSQSLIP